MKISIYIILICFTTCSIAQNTIDVSYATGFHEYLFDGKKDQDNNYIFCGKQKIPGIHSSWPLLLKVYNNGDTLSKALIKADTTGWFTSVEILDNGNYMFIGSCDSIDTTNTVGYKQKNLWIYITDTFLNTISEKFYDLSDDIFNDIEIIKSFINMNGEIVCYGKIEFDPLGHINELYIKLSQTGDTIFTLVEYEQSSDIIYNLTQIPNQSEYIGFYYGNTNKGWDKIIRMDSVFNCTSEILNLTNYNSNISPWISATHWVSDTSFILTSHVAGYNGKYQDDRVGVFLIDTAGNFYKETYCGRPDTTDYPAWYRPMAYENDSSIYVSGFMNYFAPINNLPSFFDIYLFDKEADLLGHIEMGGDRDYDVMGVVATGNNSVIIYGATYEDPENYHRDIFITEILRIQIELITNIRNTETSSLKQIDAYPNPVKDNINFYISNKTNQLLSAQLQIFKSNGKKIFEKQIKGTGNTLTINVKNLNAGTYIYRLINITSGEITSGKFIKN